MINLLAAYYENIWPFEDISCSLIFDEWKYLIKAPIWSGKSFLFFDAPRYALYKDSSRNMLNLKSKSGEISLIFEVDWMYCMIKRIITRSPAWNDKCSSQLFIINYDWENLLKDIKNLTWNTGILKWWENIIEKFESKNKKLWEINEKTFKNDTDIQNHLDTFLPPKNVFLSTVFLLQDADNIFEMMPSERLIVLKNVFNLLWIDDAKETIKQNIDKVKWDLDTKKASIDGLNPELRQNLKSLWSLIQQLEDSEELDKILKVNNDFFDNIEWFFDKITINEFSLDWLEKEPFKRAKDLIKIKLENVFTLKGEIDRLKKQQDWIFLEKQKIENNIQENMKKSQELQIKIESIDAKKCDELKVKKMQLIDKGNKLEENSDFSVFSELIQFWNKKAEWDQDMKILQVPTNLKLSFDVLETMKLWWKDLNSLIDLEKKDLKNINLQEENRKNIHNKDIENMKKEKLDKEKEIKKQEDSIRDWDKMWTEKSDFYCTDLCKKCPHINVINKQQYGQYIQQKERLEQDLQDLKSEYKSKDYDNLIKELESQKYSESDDLKKDLEKKIEEQTVFCNLLKDYLMNIWFAEWEKTYHEWESIQTDVKNLQEQLDKLEEETKNLEKYKQDKLSLKVTLHHLQESKQKCDNDIDSLEVEIQKKQTEKEIFNEELLKKNEQNIDNVLQKIEWLEKLITRCTDYKNLINELDEKLKKLKRLYSIFSKEILYEALRGHLPILSEIINNYLAQCVDYSIEMKIIDKAGKLELDAKIMDWKWEREVKSLSGGQRTVLKLVWMLAVSSYLHTPLLFLDETINNLDVDTVWKVSEMINNFVKQRTMKFYTVTHNKEIQDMQIWDDVIEVNQVEKSE